MSDTLFCETMADMTCDEIAQAAKEGAVVLWPLGVIEAHGPHLPCGTDIYVSFQGLKYTKQALEKRGQRAVIAPPYYFGINHATDDFAGSFTVRPDTMVDVLRQSMDCMARWGFKHVYGYNQHGDHEQVETLLRAFREQREQTGLDARLMLDAYQLSWFSLTGEEPHVLTLDPPMPDVPMPDIPYDVHAGCYETAYMACYYPELVHTDIAKQLPPRQLTQEQMERWNIGGKTGRAITPDVYVGAPARYDEALNIGLCDRAGDDYRAQRIIDAMAGRA